MHPPAVRCSCLWRPRLTLRKLICIAFFLTTLTPALNAQDADSTAMLEAMKAELARSQQTFKTQKLQPYFLSYEVTDDQMVSTTGEFGRLRTSSKNRSRQLDIDLRVGIP